jgi:ParB family chromosome partitioning protein
MKIKMIALTDLVLSPSNVRKTDATNGIKELAASIEAHGLLQNLQVREAASGKFEVVAGGRRLAALKLLAKRKALAKNAPVGCNVLGDEDASEISLAENEMRQAMHPADQFEAFKALTDAGHGPEDVAARFGVTPTVVRQRLKLASVSPKLMALYREKGLTLDQLMAFTVSDDHAAQEAAWFEVPEWQRSAHAIRQTLTAAHVGGDDPRAQFVTVAAYIEAGGGVITDLFQTESEGYLTDPALLDRLANEKLEREAESLRREGWSWVEIIPDPSGFDALPEFGAVRGKRQPLAAKQAKALAKLERERDSLSACDDLTDEQAERFDALDAEIAALSEAIFAFSDRQKARAGAIVSFDDRGKLVIMRGLLRPEDVTAKKPIDEAEPGEAEQSKPACYSAALAAALTAHRTAALRAVLADRPEIALSAAVHALVLTVFDVGDDSGLALRATVPYLRAEGIDDSPAVKATAGQHAAWVARLPEDETALWDWLLAQDAATVTALLAYCVACTVKPERSTATDRLTSAVALDMKQWWQPTVEGYLGRVPKTLILEAVTEGKGTAAADNIAKLKKDEMADRAAGLLTGTGWLPPMLRAA